MMEEDSLLPAPPPKAAHPPASLDPESSRRKSLRIVHRAIRVLLAKLSLSRGFAADLGVLSRLAACATQ